MTGDPVEPVSIDSDPEKGVTIAWRDGHVSHFDADVLRASCPCAECRGRRDKNLPVGTNEGASVQGAELVGAWGITFHWSDGHHTGIYTWEILRSWCACPQCSDSSAP
jgi:DUF971 family protein